MSIKTKALQFATDRGINGISSFVLNTYFAGQEFKHSREAGHGVAMSATRAIVDFAVGEALGFGYPVLMLASQAPTLAVETGKHTARTMTSAYNQRGKLGSGYFNMSQAGYTMRQRSLNAIRNNGMNINSALGNEARTYFRGSGY